ncbi:MAG TPA: GAF domain-containing protein [Anaerolineae bacterium]|nr:GAF domain-containing protein [Anaerolineae bacterium]
MDNSYSRQLRSDAISLIMPSALAFMTLISVPIIIGAYTPRILNPIAAFSIIFFTSLSLFFSARRLSLNEKPEQAGWLIIIGHLVLLAFYFAVFWSSELTLIYYLFTFFIFVSSTIITPIASLYIWGASAALMSLGLILAGEFNIDNIKVLTGSLVVNFFIALGSYLSTNEWSAALEWVTLSNRRARHRRDELFQIQEELKLANGKREYLYKQLATSFAVGQRITSILQIDILLEQVAELIKSQFGYAYVGVFTLTENEQALIMRTEAEDFPLEDHPSPPIPIDSDTTISQAVANMDTVYVDEIKTNSPHHPYLRDNIRSELALPLRMGKRPLGVLNIQSYHSHAFDEDSISMLQSLVDQIAISVQNANLYRREAKRRRLSEKLYEIGRAISGTLQLEEVLGLILNNLNNLVGYDRASLLIRRQDYLEIVAARGFPPDSDPTSTRIPLTISGDDIFMQIYYSKQPLAIPDASEHPGWHQMTHLPQARSWLGIPLIRDDQVVGMMSLVRNTVNPYTDEELSLTTTFAVQAAVAIENARLYNRIARFNQELEAQVEKRTEDLTNAYAQLERLNKNKSDFIEVASHELRTPLTVLRGYSDMLLHDATIAQNPFHQQLVSGISSGAVRMHEIVNDMLDMVKIDNQEQHFHLEEINMRVVIEAVEARLGNAFTERNITFITEGLDDLPIIQGDHDNLFKVFYQITINAIKYTPDGGQVTITGAPLSAEHSPLETDSIKLIVKDTGIGIDAEYHDLIFEKFYTMGEVALHSSGKTKFKGGGPGLGLAIAYGTIVGHKGRIWVESPGHDEETYPGTQFHILLPLTPYPQTEPQA